MRIYSDIIILGSKPYKGLKSYGQISNLKLSPSKNVLDLQIYNIKKKFVCKKICYVGGYCGENIKPRTELQYIHNQDYLIYNNLYNISLASNYLNKKHGLLILFNKTIFSPNIFRDLDKNNSYAWFDKNRNNDYKLGMNLDSDNSILNIFYGLDNTACGMYFLNKVDKQKFLHMINTMGDKMRNMFLFEGMCELINQGVNIQGKAIENKQYIMQLDSVKKIKKAQKTCRNFYGNFSNI